MKSFLLIGMGSFGHHMCEAFNSMKCEVMIVDKDGEKLEDLLPSVVSAKIGDCTKKDVLKSFDIPSFSACFVCIGSDFEASLQITSLLKELGARKVFSKAENDVQAKFLEKIGADEVVFPEKDAAKNISMKESSDSIFDCLTLTEDYLICEIMPLKEWIGKSIVDLHISTSYNLTVLAVKDSNGKLITMPGASYVFNENEHVMVLGHIKDIKKYSGK